jgi:hypothetical protein
MEIACTGLDDLYEVQDAFTELRAMFTVMLGHFQQDSTAHAFAQLGIASVDGWSSKVLQWADCMGEELVDLGTAGGAQ